MQHQGQVSGRAWVCLMSDFNSPLNIRKNKPIKNKTQEMRVSILCFFFPQQSLLILGFNQHRLNWMFCSVSVSRRVALRCWRTDLGTNAGAESLCHPRPHSLIDLRSPVSISHKQNRSPNYCFVIEFMWETLK